LLESKQISSTQRKVLIPVTSVAFVLSDKTAVPQYEVYRLIILRGQTSNSTFFGTIRSAIRNVTWVAPSINFFLGSKIWKKAIHNKWWVRMQSQLQAIHKLIRGQNEIEQTNYLIKLAHCGRHWFINAAMHAMETNSKKLRTHTVKNPVLIRHAPRHTNPTTVRVESTRDFLLCRVGYRGVFNSSADKKFGEFILPPRISNINIIQTLNWYPDNLPMYLGICGF
jgi:hypothetical protein